MDSYGHRFDSITGRDSKSHKKKSSNHSSYYEDGERKPKFVSLAVFFHLCFFFFITVAARCSCLWVICIYGFRRSVHFLCESPATKKMFACFPSSILQT